MPATPPLQVIPGRRNAVNPEPINPEFAEHAPTAEPAFPKSVFMGSRFRGNDLGRE
jgi:hypothetical protein